ncbi:MAG: tRNA uridine-5-carboxymethylaminomethyl(34) synthesis enzyme MnmG [Erysipelotrichaceae bacterium]|nr:tRNA uridine-5-carboxymethylaminomethyl(34) synthesis enzyme MnmG [Erysipelotrichaceae bacterium]
MAEVIVVGGGHAGVEAALACARKGHETILCAINKDMIASMPCNPSIGGPAKGIVVREIDALGGQMGKTADETALQFKMLNTTKGPGVQSLRVQSDRIEYSKRMIEICEQQEHLEIVEGIVEEIISHDNKIEGVRFSDGREIACKVLILTTGTYMSSLVMVSDDVKESGPDQQPTTNKLSESIRSLGLETFRLKTGTPPRILTSSIDFSKTTEQPGTTEKVCFSYETETIKPYDEQVMCYLTYTAPKTHEVIHANIHRSSMYSGVVKGVGPRYCPSIEDKLVRFSDKERHQLFLEPESLSLPTTYVQGFSTSLPYEVQEEMVHSLPGLENAVIVKYAYAIEYDALNPLQLLPSLQVKGIEGLFSAGQINGTSGYEEAAGQGLMAGINASLWLEGKEPLILKRDEAYIGVMIDDLVTKGTQEPYRLLTSRAEYRLLLRHDNADQRLTQYGYDVGLISDARYQKYQDKMELIASLKQQLKEVRFTPKHDVNAYLQEVGYEPLKDGLSIYELLKRPKLELLRLIEGTDIQMDEEMARQIEIEVKYEGYIDKARKEADRLAAMERLLLPKDINYDDVIHLSLEARQKLNKIRPLNVGQASRISGVNPADIAVLAVYLQQRHQK